MASMQIGVYHVAGHSDPDLGYACARALVQSARKVMRSTPIVHLTDLTSPAIKGVDEVRRKPAEPMALLRMRHHAGLPGPWLFVDTDVVFNRSVTHVFDYEFAVAVTSRHWPHLKTAVGFTERMPFNTGVVFSRCPRFWGEVYTRLRRGEDDAQHWMGDQAVIADVLEEGRYPLRILKGHLYNLPPAVGEDDNVHLSRRLESDAYIVHYKGPSRKPLLLSRMKAAGGRVCA